MLWLLILGGEELTAPYFGLGLRNRQANPSRHATPAVTERFARLRENVEQSLAVPLRGITANGVPEKGLFPLQRTGVSTEAMRAAAAAFLETLAPEGQKRVQFDLQSDAWRRWWNIHPYIMRHGLLLEDLSEEQRSAALGIVDATLSTTGFKTARDIMRLNYTIGEVTGSWSEYGEFVYFISIFGSPTNGGPWGWQIDGHHLIINCLVVEDQVVVTPMFMGSEPVIAEGGIFKGTAVLQKEQDIALEFARSLTPAQREKAVLYPSILSDVLPLERGRGSDGRVQAGAFRDNIVLGYEGIQASELNQRQRGGLLQIVATYTSRLRSGHDSIWLDGVRHHLDATHFMWMGSTDDDGVFYYRIHSPVILIEFDHQNGIAFDNDEPSRNHIHTVVRTPNGNDYGADYLRQHYERFAHVDGRHVARAES